MSDPIVLIHLSDIHFRKRDSGSAYDLDMDLRNELLRDAIRMKDELGVITGIVITGDIAHAGKKEEFNTAAAWLNELADNIDCESENIWIVPGNHDIDRSVINASPTTKTLHDRIRSSRDGEINESLRTYLVDDKVSAELLFKPLNEYQAFAGNFGCPTTYSKPHWSDDLQLNDGSTLRLVGLNSVIVSNGDDDENENRLVIHEAQLDFPSEDGVEYLSMCHHPPDWLRSRDVIHHKLKARTRVQLFGHKHDIQLDEFDRQSIRIIAGATHPERDDSTWEPRYNVLSFYIENDENNQRNLNICVYPRVWGNEQFGPDINICGNNGQNHKRYTYNLGPYQLLIEDEMRHEIDVVKVSKEIKSVNPKKRMIHRFLSLPYPTQMEIAGSIRLLEDGDADTRTFELFERFFVRAKERDVLSEFWEKVEQAHKDNAKAVNPFAVK